MLKVLPYIVCLVLLCPMDIAGQLITIEEVDWNTEFNEFAPVIYGEEIVYCSDRPSQFGVKWVSENGQPPVKVYRTGMPEGKRNQYLNPGINSIYNEGPVCFNKSNDQIYYTGTVVNPSNKKIAALGIFTCRKNGNTWSESEPFKFNSRDASYNLAHPMFSKNDSTLYFASNMHGSNGGMDIFYCTLTDQGWTDPINMGPLVNSEFNECYPFVDEFSNFFFSSDRNPSSKMDIYECKFNKDHYLEPSALNEPMNSAFDDFAYSSINGSELGYFSSNRNGPDDDIFKFEYSYPSFENCPPAEQPTFCYYFEETSIVPNDTMKFIYEWEL